MTAAGGRALADGGSAAEAMVAAAQEAFGRLDAVVNNAGILREGIPIRPGPLGAAATSL